MTQDLFVDSLHDGMARLVDADGNQCIFPALWLPPETTEGNWISMSCVLNLNKTRKEYDAVQSLLDELMADDKGCFPGIGV